MAASNDTVDDSSPLLIFEPASAWNHTAGAGSNSYVNSTFSSTDVSGATCKFSFNGTGFWVMGAKKANYGQYLVLLDNVVQEFANATAPQTQFGQVLGGASGLNDTSHTIVFMAAGGGPVGVDAIVYENTDKQANGSSGVQTASVPSSSSSHTASISSSSSSPTASVSSSSSSQTASISSSSSSQTASVSSSSGSQTTAVSSSSSSQAAPAQSSSSGNRISANPHAQGPNESSTSQNASASAPSSSPRATPPASSISSNVSSTTASSSGRPSQPNAQPNGQANTTAQTDARATAPQGAQPTAQPNAQPNAQPSAQPVTSGPTRSSTSSALGPSASQAEQANSPQIAGTSNAQKGLPLGAIIGIGIGVAVALLLLVALLFCLMRRRRRAATARKRMTAGLPSPTLPLQDPARHASYFFDGYGSNNNSNSQGPAGGNDMREAYLARGPQSFSSGATTPGRTTPYMKDAGMPRPMAPAVVRESIYSNADSASLASEDGYITDASSKTVPTRPPRPPNLRLSVV